MGTRLDPPRSVGPSLPHRHGRGSFLGWQRRGWGSGSQWVALATATCCRLQYQQQQQQQHHSSVRSNKTRSSTPAHTTYCRPRPCTQPLLRSPRRPCIQRPRVHLAGGRVTDRSRTRSPLLATSNSGPFLASLGSRATYFSLLTPPAINRAASQSLSPDRTSLLAMLLTTVYPHGSSCSSLPPPHSVPCTSSGDDLAQMARTTIRRCPGSSPDTSCRAWSHELVCYSEARMLTACHLGIHM